MVGPLLFGVILLAIALADGAPWWIWAGIPGCLAVSGIFLWRYGPRRLLDREPALVIDEHGICDRVKGIEVAWDEIERLVPWEQVAGSATQRWLGIVPKDEDAVLAGTGARCSSPRCRATSTL